MDYSTVVLPFLSICVMLLLLLDEHQASAHPRHRHHNRGRIQDGDFVLSSVEDEEVGERTDLSTLLTEDEIRVMRISFIRQQILDKLNLKSPPNVTAEMRKQPLPEPISRDLMRQEEQAYDDDLMQGDQPPMPSGSSSKTTQIIIIAKPASACPTKPYAACFMIELPAELDENTLAEAQLMIHKRGDPMDVKNQTLALYELRDDSIPGKTRKFMDSINTDVKEGWINLNLNDAIKQWTQHQLTDPSVSRKHIIQIICKTCSHDSPPIHLDGDKAPYVTINFEHDDLPRRQRLKRGSEHERCHGNCCLHSLYVNMHENDDDRWIMQPQGFYANYCQGSCSVRVNRSRMPARLRQSLLHNYEMQKRVLHLCCVPVEYEPLKIVYINNDGVITTAEIQEMEAKTCACK